MLRAGGGTDALVGRRGATELEEAYEASEHYLPKEADWLGARLVRTRARLGAIDARRG